MLTLLPAGHLLPFGLHDVGALHDAPSSEPEMFCDESKSTVASSAVVEGRSRGDHYAGDP